MRWMFRPGLPGHLVALAAGLLTPLALAPLNAWPLGLLSVLLLALGLRQPAPGGAALRGWCYGLGAFLAGTSWVYVSIHDYGSAPPALAGLLTLLFCMGLALFFALFGWLWARWLRRPQAGVADALAFAALWLAIDALRGWLLTGFPWLYLGYSQIEGPLAGLAPLGGVWLTSFVLVLSGALLAALPRLLVRAPSAIAALLLMGVAWGGGLYLGGWQWTQPAGAMLKVSTMQGNIEQSTKWDPEMVGHQLRLYHRLTASAPQADLYVWPETAVPMMMHHATSYLQAMGELASSRNAALITGIPAAAELDGRYRYFNALTVTGQGSGTWLKQKLVPFGEYVPLQDYLRGLIAFFNLPMSDFATGPADQPLLQARGLQIAPFICYEVVYPEFARTLAAQSDLLLTVSNDAWFGKSIGPLQHLQMAQMRALESGRWMIRGTNNGVTALIDPQGRVTARLPAFEEGVLNGEVQAMQGLTPWLQFGSWPLGGLCVLLLLWARLEAGRERRMFRSY